MIDDNPKLFLPGGKKRGRASKRKAAPSRSEAQATGPGFLFRTVRAFGYLVVIVQCALAGASVGGIAAYLHKAPPIEEVESYRPPETTMLLDRDGKPLAALFEQRRIVVPIESLPTYLPEAFVAIEDNRFRQHVGVDPVGLLRAVAINLMRGRLTQGGSTITQQTVRNLLPSIGFQRSIKRKVLEALVALQMERYHTKSQILEVYLNQIYLGSGNYGVEAASRAYFGKPAGELDYVEAATLAGLPQIPERYSPLNDPEAARNRRDQVLVKMWEHGIITDDQFERGVVRSVVVSPDRIPAGDAAYFVDAVRRYFTEHPDLDGRRLHQAGWQVRTTLDQNLQKLAEEILPAGLDKAEETWLTSRKLRFREERETPAYYQPPRRGQVRMAKVFRVFENSIVVELPSGWRADLEIPEAAAKFFEDVSVGDGVDLVVTKSDANRRLFYGELMPKRRLQGALVCLDSRSGDVRALVGGKDFTDWSNNGMFNRAVLARRQAGSTLKPLFFGAALEKGFTPWSTIMDSPMSFSDGYAPRNYEKRFFGETSLQEALAHSRNVVTIKLIQQVGLRNALAYVASFQRVGSERWKLPREWPVVLGTSDVTPLEIAAAYQPLANNGLAKGPRFIEGVWTNEDREPLGFEPREPEVLLGSQSAASMSQMLLAVMTEGTGASLRPMLPPSLRDKVAGKSGTTNDNRDAWFAGFTPYEVIVVWVGFDQPLPLGPGLTGSRAAGPIWAEFAAQVWESKSALERMKDLPLPSGYTWEAVSPVDGRVLHPGTPQWIDPPHWRALPTSDLPHTTTASLVRH